jgi:trans-o-hydroxybenzylidenepyruvate hydratase-aldolase
MLTHDDIRGVMAMVPTPCVEGGEHWSNIDSVDLEESARMTEILVRDGVGGIALCGTTGECAALLWEEKVRFVDTVVQANRGRVPIFAGATALGTKETIRQMLALKDIGADGAFIGLPLWQTPTLENSIRWFEELGEAVPDMPIMVYSNSMFFKFSFPLAFWIGVAERARTVITNKIASPAINEDLEEIVRLTGDRITYLPSEREVVNAYGRVGDKIKGFWSTCASMGAEPVVALGNAMLKGDVAGMDEAARDIAALPVAMPPPEEGQPPGLPMLNAQMEKARTRASGYIACGMSRTPYLVDDLPDDWRVALEKNGKAWAELRKKYVADRSSDI